MPWLSVRCAVRCSLVSQQLEARAELTSATLAHRLMQEVRTRDGPHLPGGCTANSELLERLEELADLRKVGLEVRELLAAILTEQGLFERRGGPVVDRLQPDLVVADRAAVV